jgi:hypothetical protein
MRTHSIRIAAVLLAVLGVGCSSGGNTYTCSFAASVGVCYQWTTSDSLSSTQISELQDACTAGGGAGSGTFSTGSNCPSSNRVGSCALSDVGVSGVSYAWVLYSPAYTATTGQAFCTEVSGTWTAG